MSTIKSMAVAVLLTLVSCFPAQSESEISLFDQSGDPVAYIATDEELTIYMWGGKPAAYLYEDNVYGFNGKHLGWFDEGIIWDHEGRIAGFLKGAVRVYTHYEPYKGYKEYKPYKSYKEYAPYRPAKNQAWSPTPLALLLLSGAS